MTKGKYTFWIRTVDGERFKVIQDKASIPVQEKAIVVEDWHDQDTLHIVFTAHITSITRKENPEEKD